MLLDWIKLVLVPQERTKRRRRQLWMLYPVFIFVRLFQAHVPSILAFEWHWELPGGIFHLESLTSPWTPGGRLQPIILVDKHGNSGATGCDDLSGSAAGSDFVVKVYAAFELLHPLNCLVLMEQWYKAEQDFLELTRGIYCYRSPWDVSFSFYWSKNLPTEPFNFSYEIIKAYLFAWRILYQ